MSSTTDVAFTPAVMAIQERRGSRRSYARVEEKGGGQNTVTPELAAFIAERNSFYFATASSDGQPYVQNTDQTVEATAKAAGAAVVGFQRLAVGEGIENVNEDYAAEVAKAMQV